MANRAAAELDAVTALGRAFHTACAATLGGRKWHAHFEQWLWAARANNLTSGDPLPVLPAPVAPAATAELARKLARAGQEQAAAEATCQRLGELAAELAAKLASCKPRNGSVSLRVLPANEPGIQQPEVGLLEIAPSAGGPRVLVSRSHLDKLRTLHTAASAAGNSSASAPDEPAFLAACYCALARVLALQGGEPRAGGMQAACSPAVFDSLRADFGLRLEGFASPLNCRFAPFCSAAEDVDAVFGSLGSFYGARATAALGSGAHLLNPPYEAAAVSALASWLDLLLASATTAHAPLTCFVVLPHWPDKPCWQALDGSRYRAAALLLPQADHGFCEGAQQYRPALWRLSNHPTTVFVLQSPVAATANPFSPGAERRLRAAFAAPVAACTPPVFTEAPRAVAKQAEPTKRTKQTKPTEPVELTKPAKRPAAPLSTAASGQRLRDKGAVEVAEGGAEEAKKEGEVAQEVRGKRSRVKGVVTGGGAEGAKKEGEVAQVGGVEQVVAAAGRTRCQVLEGKSGKQRKQARKKLMKKQQRKAKGVPQ